jgi:epsilon-lactone hydrolase
LPPVRVHLGDDEMLRDDSLHYVQRAVAAGVDAQVDVWTGMPHGFLGSFGRLEAADAALKLLGDFLAQRLATARATLAESRSQNGPVPDLSAGTR